MPEIAGYSRCNKRNSRLYVNCMVSEGVLAGEEICTNDSIEWPEMPLTNEGVNVDTVDYCWVVMASEKEDVSYCDNVVGEYAKSLCETYFGGAL